MKILIAFLFLSFCGITNLYSQSINKPLIKKIDGLITMAEKLYYNTDSMLNYAKEANKLSIKARYKQGEAISLKFLGVYDHSKSNFADALLKYKKAVSMFREQNNKLEIAKTELSIATIYNNTNDFAESTKYALSALKTFEKLKDTKGQGKIFNVLGIVSAKQGDFKHAKEYFLQYNNLAKLGTDSVALGYSYNNLGSVDRDMQHLDSALYYFKIGSALFKKTKYYPGQALADKNIGAIYYDRKDYNNALTYALKGLTLNIKIGDKRAECHSYHDIGSCFRQLGNNLQASIYYKKALKLAATIDEKEILRNSNAEIAQINEALANYKDALVHYKLFKQANDSIYSSDKIQIIKELETKYETEKKTQAIKTLNQQSIIQNLQIKRRNISLIVAGVLLLFIISTAYFINNHRRQKASVDLQIEINKQQDIAARSVLNAEEHERRRIASDLHDGVGQLLSAALMNLNGLVDKLKLSGELNLQAEHTLALVNESYDEMRTISHQMMPNALIKAGLASAVKEFLSKIDQDKIKVNLEVSGLNDRLDEQTETVLYRVIQEIVNNVIKHSKATKLQLQLVNDEDGISVTVEDNGIGFDKSQTDLKDGIGLGNIYSRIEFLKGSVEVDSSPGKGTLIAIYIPNQNS